MTKFKKINFLLFSVLFLKCVFADSFELGSNYSVCFTPDENCTQLILDAIESSVSDIKIQAYSFTSRSIENALSSAKERGVKVQVILDKSILSNPGNAAEFFVKHHIPVWIDYHVGIAHNKVMFLDEARVITGSFNFTRAAQMRNAENLLIIDDGNLAKKYLNNWQRRQDVSEVYSFVPDEKITVPPAVKHMDFFEWSRQMIKWFSAAF